MKLLILCLSLMTASESYAQEYGLLAGFHQSTAKTSNEGFSPRGVFNFDLGLAMAFELLPAVRFRTGAIYNERHVDFQTADRGLTTTLAFSYIDVPIDVQYNFNEMVGVFGGLVVGINVSDRVKVPTGDPSGDPGAKALYPLLNVGVAFLFQNMIGFDLYYDHGLGDYAHHASDLSSYGGNFIYWF